MRLVFAALTTCSLFIPSGVAAQLPRAILEIWPWQSSVSYNPSAGPAVDNTEAAFGDVIIEEGGGTIRYVPTPSGDFWTFGVDRFDLTLAVPGGPPLRQRVAVRGTAPASIELESDFEPDETTPPLEDPEVQFFVGHTGALLGEGGVLVTLDGSGSDAYFSFEIVEEHYLPDTVDAGCADIRIGLGGPPRHLDGCLRQVGGQSVCEIALLRGLSESEDPDPVFELELGLAEGASFLRAAAYAADGSREATDWIEVDDEPHAVRVDWWTGEDGGVRLLVDGAVAAEKRGVVSEWVLAEVHVGALGVDPGADARFAFDAVTLRRGLVSAGIESLTEDAFETDLSAWEESGLGGGTLDIAPAAALAGDAGLEIGIGSGWGTWLLDPTPSAESALAVTFSFDADGLSLGPGETAQLLAGHVANTGTESRFQVRLWNDGTDLRIRAGAETDTGDESSLPYTSLTPGPHRLDLLWQAATEDGSDDGRLRLWLDGERAGELVRIDNDLAVVESVRFGIFYLKPLTSGTLVLDEFDSWH